MNKKSSASAAKIAKSAKHPGHFLFPGDEDPIASRNLQIQAKDYLGKLSNSSKARFTIIGCYDYSFSGDENRHGHTGFAYGIFKSGKNGDYELDVVPGRVPPDKVIISKDPFSGGDVK
ncbi:MAG: hypothetical protein ACREC9_12320 [Methylocella sp.]